jgi:cell shape-determining protein MreC
MSNYDEAIKIVDKIYNKTDFTKEELQPLIDYLNKSETTEKEHEALKKDVARYFDLLENYEDYTNEFRTLYEELSKVGKEE